MYNDGVTPTHFTRRLGLGSVYRSHRILVLRARVGTGGNVWERVEQRRMTRDGNLKLGVGPPEAHMGMLLARDHRLHHDERASCADSRAQRKPSASPIPHDASHGHRASETHDAESAGARPLTL